MGKSSSLHQVLSVKDQVRQLDSLLQVCAWQTCLHLQAQGAERGTNRQVLDSIDNQQSYPLVQQHIGGDTRETIMAGILTGTDSTEEAQQPMDSTQDLDVAPLWEDSLWSQAATWPRLHEDLFLQKDPEWMDGSHVWPTSSSNMSQASTLGDFDTVSSSNSAGSWQAAVPNVFSSGASPLNVPLQHAADRAGPSGIAGTQEQVTSELIKIALDFSNSASGPSDRASLWQRTSRKVEDVFEP